MYLLTFTLNHKRYQAELSVIKTNGIAYYNIKLLDESLIRDTGNKNFYFMLFKNILHSANTKTMKNTDAINAVHDGLVLSALKIEEHVF
jgi:hypothetical protein